METWDQWLGTYLTRRINMTLSTTLFIERVFFIIAGGFFGLGYPIRDMQASIRFSLSNKINVQHNDRENART